MKLLRRLGLVLALLAGMFITIGAHSAAAAAPSYCPAGWFFYVHAPYPNAFGGNEMDAWGTCVPNGTSTPWPDAALGWGCGIQEIDNYMFVPDTNHPGQYHWARYGVNYMNGAGVGGWGNTTNAGVAPWSVYYDHSGYTYANYWFTTVYAYCPGAGYFWANTSSVQRL